MKIKRPQAFDIVKELGCSLPNVEATTRYDGSPVHIPGLVQPLVFDEELLQRQFDNITGLLTPLAVAAREFAEAHQAAKVQR